MKAVFNIPPSSVSKGSLHLLIEMGSYGVSFLWYTRNPVYIRGIAVYNFNSSHIESHIDRILQAQLNNITGLASVTISYDLKENVLLPSAYNHEPAIHSALTLLHGDAEDIIVNNDHITSAGIYNHYRIARSIEIIFGKQFPGAIRFHSTSLQTEHFSNGGNGIYCIVFHNCIKVILMNDKKLQLVQYFDYSIPEDVAYHLLNTCEQHNIKSSDITLTLSGMIDEQSKLYTELYQYFSNISFQNNPAGVNVPDEIKQWPEHFFSHLILLAVCVS